MPSEVHLIKKETKKLCACNTSLIYGIKNPICSATGFGGQKGVARECEASGWLNSLPLHSRLFLEAFQTCLRHGVVFLGISAAGGVQFTFTLTVWCSFARHSGGRFEMVSSGTWSWSWTFPWRQLRLRYSIMPKQEGAGGVDPYEDSLVPEAGGGG